jgi:hypothetical protein
MLGVVTTFASGVVVPSEADHRATETHVDADHGPHDGYVVTTDQRAESRSIALPPLPAERARFGLRLPEQRAPRLDSADHTPGHPPPKLAPARSPPHAV